MVQEKPVVGPCSEADDDRAKTIRSPKRCSRRTILVGVLLVAIGAIVAAVLVAVGGGNNNSLTKVPVLTTLAPSVTPSSTPSTSPRPSVSPTNSFETDLIELIQSRSPETDFLGNNVAAAFDWILSDPYSLALAGNDDRLVQRFSLATVWFAFGLEAFSQRAFQGWMQPTDECDWSGSVQRASCSDDAFFDYFSLMDNEFSGSIPIELTLLSHLTHLGLFAKPLTGTLP